MDVDVSCGGVGEETVDCSGDLVALGKIGVACRQGNPGFLSAFKRNASAVRIGRVMVPLSDSCCPLKAAWEIFGSVFDVDYTAGGVGDGMR